MNRLYKLNEEEYKLILSKIKYLILVFQNVIDLVHSKQSNKEIIYKMKDSQLPTPKGVGLPNSLI